MMLLNILVQLLVIVVAIVCFAKAPEYWQLIIGAACFGWMLGGAAGSIAKWVTGNP